MRLTLDMPSPAVAAGLEDRSVTGVALPYREVGHTSAGAVSVAAGAVRLPADLTHVKLFTDHGRATPVGYATAADDSPDRLDMTFHVAGTPAGDTALLEAAEHVRDALSVELSDVTIRHGVIVSAALDAVALVPLPAYRSARLMLAADTDPDDVELEVTVTVTEPAQVDTPTDDDESADADTDQEEHDVTTHPPAPPAPTEFSRPGGLTLAGLSTRLAAAVRGASDAAQVNAALSDIVPGDDTSDGAYIRPQWVDELWTPVFQQLFLTNAVGSAPLTGTRVFGWKWITRPVVGDYAGNKTAIPSNKVAIGPGEADAYRLAGGWDLDRIFVDLGDSSIVTAVLNMAAVDLANKIEAKISAAVIAGGTPVTYTGANPFEAVGLAVSTVVAAGANPSFVAMSSDLFAGILNVTTSNAPWWLQGGSVSVPNGTASLPNGVNVGMVAALPVGTVIAGDRRALTHYAGPSPRLQALNIPNGGIDIALMGYGADLVHDADGLAVVTVDDGTP